MPPPLEERFYETQQAQLTRWLPWLQLFRAFRIALDARMILLGALAAIALTFGDALINALPFAPQPGAATGSSSVYIHDTYLQGPGFELNVYKIPFLNSAGQTDSWPRLLRPLRSVIEPGATLFQTGNSWADAAYAWTQLLFHLALWSLLGGAIARIAAVRFARHESLTAFSAVRFTAARFGSIIGAPLLPLVFIGFFWIVCLLLGLVGRIPAIGPSVVATLWFLPLLAGIALAVMLLVIAAGWPLMVATISTEGTDAFDGLSRGYDYILNRTWYALWLLLLTLLYGTLVLLFAEAVTNYAVQLAGWSISSGMGDRVHELSALRAPQPGDPTQVGSAAAHGYPATAAAFWIRGLSWLLQGLEISFFWTAATISYFLLRLSLDAKPLHDVYVPSTEPEQKLPLVGIAASERREHDRGDAAAETSASDSEGGSPEQTDD